MSTSILNRIPTVTKNLLIINIIVFAFEALLPGAVQRFDDLLALHYVSSPGFKIWQVFTYMFLHANFTHLFFNMFALWMFGSVLEWTLGRRRFLFFYISCGIGAALIQLGVYAVILSKYQAILDPSQFHDVVTYSWECMHGNITAVPTSILGCPVDVCQSVIALVNVPCVGASGAIFGLLLAFAMLYPNREMYFMFIPVPIKAKWMVLGYCLLELSLGIGGAADGVAHFAHIGGALVGFIILFYWKKKGTFCGWY